MRVIRQSFLTSLILVAALSTCGGVNAQQASFAVAITLHTAMKPVAAAQLCTEGKPMDILGVAIRVDCPKVANASATNVLGGSARASGQLARPPEITVTF